MTLAEAFLRSGKVRDLYALPSGRLLLVASDRISAFDVVLPTVVPDKGRVLTGISRFWFAETAGIVRNHLLDTDPAVIADSFAAAFEAASDAGAVPDFEVGELGALRGRVMICRPTTVLPIEAVVRGFLAGSGWKEYVERGTVCGIPIPPGLREGDRLPEPIFTPATKAAAGEHDRNISFDEMIEHIAREKFHVEDLPEPHAAIFRGSAGALAERVRDLSLRLYGYGSAVTARAGIILADTKFEFGTVSDGDDEPFGPPEERIGRRLVGARMEPVPSGPIEASVALIDEAMTPDSSRFWDAATYEPGRAQASYDKQYVRDWLERQPWAKTAPGPELPADVVAGTRVRYVEAYERITGASFERYLEEDVVAR
jgi:phosphoribosylaminoimidazole-succinocarboxamide synthase